MLVSFPIRMLTPFVILKVVVDKKYVPEDVMAVFEQKPKVLPAWDPLGALARA